jgi:hypothetical protein
MILLDQIGVVTIATKRKCKAAFSDVAAVISVGSGKVSIVAITPGMWDASEVLRACNRARGTQQFVVPDCAVLRNKGGIDEGRIAGIVAADGMRTHYSAWHNRAGMGDPTVGFVALDPNKSMTVLKALYTLQDLGLATVSRDRAGRYSAAWTDRAYLPAGKEVAA